MLRWLALLMLVVLMGLGLARNAHANILTIDRAVTTTSEDPHFPDGPARVISLPDDWAQSRSGHTGSVWYRVAFDVEDAQEELLALYIERACSNVEVQINGHRVFVSGRMKEPITRNCNHPQLVTLPTALLRGKRNVLDLRVHGVALQSVASPARAGGLSALQLGPLSELAPVHAQATLLRTSATMVSAVTLVVLGLLMLGLAGVQRRRATPLAYFGLLCLLWALRSARSWWQDVPVSTLAFEVALLSLLPWVVLAAVQYLVRSTRRQSALMEAALVVQSLLVPVSLLAGGHGQVYLWSCIWSVVFALEVLAAMAFNLYLTWREDRSHFVGIAAIVALMVGALVTHITLLLMGREAPEWVLGVGLPLLLLGMGARLLRQVGMALQAAEHDRDTLDNRVQLATAEIEANYTQLAEVRVEQVAEKERKRIAADLHDDLGAKLLTIVHTSESERISTLAREALEEMRLSVRGLTGKPVRLSDALADWRAEVVSRLGQANIEVEWHSPVDEVEQLLPARAFVQTTRILRESISNIIKHSGASLCVVKLEISSSDFAISVQDNGKGIPLELDGRLDRGHGMASMKHRAKQLNGQCLVESGPGYGTVIRLTLPL